MALRLRNPLKLLRSHSLVLDAGSSQTRIADAQAEILLDEPTVIAIEQSTGSVVAVGQEAKSYLGKAPERIQVIRPIQAGVIVEYDAAVALLRVLLDRVTPDDGTRIKLCAVVGQCISPMERNTFATCLKASGASRVDLVDSALCAGIGSGQDIRDSKGRLFLGIGAGLAEASVLCLSDVVRYECAALGAERFHEAVSQHLTASFQVAIGENMAEQATLHLGWADRPAEARHMTLTGKYVANGTPCALELTDEALEGALVPALDALENLVRTVMEKSPAELVADIADTGLTLYGGGAQLHGLDTALTKRLGLRTRIAPVPALTVVRGASAAIRPDLEFRKLLIK